MRRGLLSCHLLPFSALLAGCLGQGGVKPDDSGGCVPAEEVPYDGLDQDCDGADLTDVDGDGHDALAVGGDDCDDADAVVNPGAPEVCDEVDDDCDGLVDGQDPDLTDGTTWCQDLDGDGFGDPAVTDYRCSQPAGYVADCSDCDDGDAAINPGAPEVCDGVDQDCDGEVDDGEVQGAATWFADDDGDGWGDAARSVQTCEAPGGYVADAGDCDDADAAVHPGAPEVCDEVDDDCDGLVDGQDPDLTDGTTWCQDLDGDGFGDPAVTDYRCSQPAGYVADCADCDDGDVGIFPGAVELCDEVDDDCDGLTDEADAADAPLWFADDDGDGWGDAARSVQACEAPAGYAADPGDCDDADAAVHPGAPEVCDEVDDDCDGLVDGQDPDLTDGTTWCQDLDGDGFGDPAVTDYRCSQPSGYVADCSDCDDADPSGTGCVASADDGAICASLMGTDDGLVPAWTGACDSALGFSSYGGHCYYAVATHTTWPDARASCLAAGGYLATITDTGENSFVKGMNSRPYLGACDGDLEGTWTWITGEPWSYTNWASGEPNDYTTGEDCLEFGNTSNLLWNDIWCDHYSYGAGYVCEFESSGASGDTGEPGDTGEESSDTGAPADTSEPAAACGSGFTCLDLSDDVNRDHTYGPWTDDPSESFDVAPGVHSWTVADGSAVDFVIIDPDANGGASLMLTKGGETWRPSYSFPEEFVIDGEGASGGRMHVAGLASSWSDPTLFAGVAASLTLDFTDGTVQTILLENGVNLDDWNHTWHSVSSPDAVRVYEDLTYGRHIDALTVTLDSTATIDHITVLDDASVHTGTAEKTSVAIFAITVEP